MDSGLALAVWLVGASMSLAMICPTRGRPESVARMGQAWEATGTNWASDLYWIVDADDERIGEYKTEIGRFPWMKVASIPEWRPMVPKLNWAARQFAGGFTQVGFLGDDHLPRSSGWDLRLAAALDAMPSKTGIVYGRDGHQDRALPTWWAMSSNIVQALGRMVPADVQHLYCDNSIFQLGDKSGTLQYLEDVLIEHMHPVAGKAEWDPAYVRVNRKQQYLRDRLGFEAWVLDGMWHDASLVAELRGV